NNIILEVSRGSGTSCSKLMLRVGLEDASIDVGIRSSNWLMVRKSISESSSPVSAASPSHVPIPPLSPLSPLKHDLQTRPQSPALVLDPHLLPDRPASR